VDKNLVGKLIERFGIWGPCCVGLFLFLALRGQGAAAFLILASGIFALPEMADTFRRYGLSQSSQFKACLTAAAASCIVILTASVPVESSESTETGDPLPTPPSPPDDAEAPTALYEPNASAAPDLQQVYGCTAVDGDTLNCGGETIRLLGIDAPELPGHCRVDRACAPGDPFVSKRTLQSSLLPAMAIERIDVDRYGRTVATVFGDGQSLSCLQLLRGQALYMSEWDNGRRVASECGYVFNPRPG
jgi:micrococcal nuclease